MGRAARGKGHPRLRRAAARRDQAGVRLPAGSQGARRSRFTWIGEAEAREGPSPAHLLGGTFFKAPAASGQVHTKLSQLGPSVSHFFLTSTVCVTHLLRCTLRFGRS